MIPSIIHFVWIGDEMPAWACRNVEEFRRQNPDHDILIHGRDSLVGDLADVADDSMHPSTLADLVRLDVLNRFGGWYCDVDIFPLRPVEDAERAFGLDGQRMFISRQNHRVPFNNCVMATAPGSRGIRRLIDLAKSTAHESRCSFGPDLLTRAVTGHESDFAIADYQWCMPCGHFEAHQYYRHAVHGNTEPLRHANRKTHGQMPYMLHLWANGKDELLEDAFSNPPSDKPVAMVEAVECDRLPMAGITKGFEAIGWDVVKYPKHDWQAVLQNMIVPPQVVVIWNDRGENGSALKAEAIRMGCEVLIVENGFFDRTRYAQVDHQGFLHRASWVDRLREPAPDPDRLWKFVSSVDSMSASTDGYILVIGQVDGDTQMLDSEISGSVPLQKHVARSLPVGTKVYFRPHPQMSMVTPNSRHVSLPRFPDQANEALGYRRTKSGNGLAAALSGARFIITINSNSIVEALIAGVPCLAFGPSTAIEAGVARKATLATLEQDIAAMMAGWRPDQWDVLNYLQWLACRQWSADELAQGDVLRGLLSWKEEPCLI